MKNRKRFAALLLCGALAGTMTMTSAGTALLSTVQAAESTTTENTSSENQTSEGSTSEGSSGAEKKGQKPSGSSDNGGTPPEKPSGGSDNGGTPPEKPSGSSDNGGTPPEKPSGSGDNGGTPPEMPSDSGNGQSAGNAPGGSAPSGGGADTQSYDYSGTLSGTLTADGSEKASDGETVSAEDADVNAALAENGGTLTITKGTLQKSGDDTNGDNCNFYGLNSILLSSGEGSMAYISDSELSADSEGSNGIFATDSGTVYANSDTITTTAGNSRGLDSTYGGTIVANDMTISTQGDHCAALATDRGGGSVSVTNSKLTTAGSGSPLLYSTGDIEVDNVTGTASGSQIAGMEGLNTILIWNSDLASTNTSTTGSDPVANGVIIYQSTSGDAETTTGETATFQAVDSSLSSSIESGAMFYVTNTTANILLENTDLSFDSSKANLLQIEGNDSNNWGSAGSNGGTVTFTARGETLSGDISVDTISSLDLYLLDGTTYTGAMTIKENADGGTASDAPITVNLSSDSTWVVTGDTTISALNAEDGAKIVDSDGKTVTIVCDGKTVVEGDSDITVTVTGTYSDTVTTGSANEAATDYIDRTGFDSYYGTSTAFTTNGSGTTEAAAQPETAEKTAAVTEKKAGIPAPAALVIIAAAAFAGILALILGRRKKAERKAEKENAVDDPGSRNSGM